MLHAPSGARWNERPDGSRVTIQRHLLGLQHGDAISKLETAVSRARKAKDYEISGKHDDAIYYLRLLFAQ